MVKGVTDNYDDSRHTPESIRGKLSELVKEVTRPSYYGTTIVTIATKDGRVVAYKESLERTY